MTKQEIQSIVRETIAELRKQRLMQDDFKQALQLTGQRLSDYYRGKADTELTEVLDRLRNDIYFNIIPMYYRNGNTLELIAHIMHTDTSTISRNKKRLCLEIYSELN